MRSQTNGFANAFTTLRPYDFPFLIDDYGLCQRDIDFGMAREDHSGTDFKSDEETMSIPRWQEHMILISEEQRRGTGMLVIDFEANSLKLKQLNHFLPSFQK